MQRRTFTVNYTHEGDFASRYPALARFPFVLDSRPGYHRLANAFLIDRGLGLWSPNARQGATSVRIPTDKSLKNYAQWLANFLEWAEVRGVDILTCRYTADVSGRYQSEMLQGAWSRDGVGRSPTTVNLRVQQACDYLSWLSEKGHRAPFEVPYVNATVRTGSATSSVGHLGQVVRVRQGKVRQVPTSLQMPTDEEVRCWLQRVYGKYGTTRGLMCETVLLTAMRREEVVCLRSDALPESRDKWLIANPLAPPDKQQVKVGIQFGTKGPSYGLDNGDKIGPYRQILVPRPLALRWDEYRNGDDRSKAFGQRLKGTRGAARAALAAGAVRLFLGTDGKRLDGPQFREAWVGVTLPVRGWSPHKGRHWWACSVLWRELQKHQNIGQLSSETAAALLESTALSIIKLQIQPQLGHADDRTTMMYLRWAMEMVSVPVSI